MATTCLLIVLSVAAQLGGIGRRYVNENGDAVIDPCIVKVQDEVRIPAQEAGVLIKMSVKEGARMSKGDVLATIDDREARMGLRVAGFGFEAAKQRASDMIEETYAGKAAEVAKIDWDQALKANKELSDAVPEIEVRQKKLVWERSNLQIQKAQKDRKLSALDADTKQAELEAAQMAVDIRSILAPFDGEVVDMYRHESEWVNPGDSILKLVRFDALYVEGYVYAKDFDREELQGRSVTVGIAKARGREVSVPGTVIHVSSVVQGGGEYLVRAEVQNQLDGDNWLIQPGLKARMTIHLSPESKAKSRESRVEGQEPERR